MIKIKKTGCIFGLLLVLVPIAVEITFRLTLFNGNSPNYRGGSIYSELRENLITQGQPSFYEQPYLYYSNNPGLLNYKSETEVNNLGLRQKEETKIVKLDSTYRILFLGGPATWSMMNDGQKAFPALIEKSLNQKIQNYNQSYSKVECLNAGLRGGTSAEFLTHYVFKFQYLQPDLIVLHCGFNDAVNYLCQSYNIEYQPDYHTTRKFVQESPPMSPLIRFLLHSKAMSYVVIRFMYSDYIYRVPHGNPFYRFKNENLWFQYGNDSMFASGYNAFYNNVKNLVLLAHSKQQRVLFAPDVYYETNYDTIFGKSNKETLVSGLYKNYEFINRLSAEMNVPVCTLTRKHFTDEMFLPGDDRYVNEKGEVMKAYLIEQSIINIVKSNKED